MRYVYTFTSVANPVNTFFSWRHFYFERLRAGKTGYECEASAILPDCDANMRESGFEETSAEALRCSVIAVGGRFAKRHGVHRPRLQFNADFFRGLLRLNGKLTHSH